MPRHETCRACGNSQGLREICGNCRRKLPVDLKERLRFAFNEGDEFEREAAVLAALEELSA